MFILGFWRTSVLWAGVANSVLPSRWQPQVRRAHQSLNDLYNYTGEGTRRHVTNSVALGSNKGQDWTDKRANAAA